MVKGWRAKRTGFKGPHIPGLHRLTKHTARKVGNRRCAPLRRREPARLDRLYSGSVLEQSPKNTDREVRDKFLDARKLKVVDDQLPSASSIVGPHLFAELNHNISSLPKSEYPFQVFLQCADHRHRWVIRQYKDTISGQFLPDPAFLADVGTGGGTSLSAEVGG